MARLDHLKADERRFQVIEARLAGGSWREIADRFGYAYKQGAHQAAMKLARRMGGDWRARLLAVPAVPRKRKPRLSRRLGPRLGNELSEYRERLVYQCWMRMKELAPRILT